MKLLLLTLLAVLTASAEPIRLHPENPHYFLFEGRPTVLITSGEHYGAVLNRDFNYKRYLDTLRADRLNNTNTPPATTPGGGSAALRRQLRRLRAFFDQIPFVRMRQVGQGTVRGPQGAAVRALEAPGEVYAVYVHHGLVSKDEAKLSPKIGDSPALEVW